MVLRYMYIYKDTFENIKYPPPFVFIIDFRGQVNNILHASLYNLIYNYYSTIIITTNLYIYVIIIIIIYNTFSIFILVYHVHLV